MEFPAEYLDFVNEHRGDDPVRLRLRFHDDAREWIPYAINNISALRKCAKFRLRDGEDFTPRVIPLEVSAQQSTSAEVALLHSRLAGEAHRVLDMTFGLGLDAAMMSSMHGRTVLGFELQELLVDAAEVNFAERPNVDVIHGDSVEYIRNYTGLPYDLIFIDPARRGDCGQRLFNLHDCQPDLIELIPLLKRNGKMILAKLSPMLDVTQTLRDLPGTTQLHIVEEGGECKELFAMISAEPVSEPEIVIDRFTAEGLRQWSFTRQEESSARCRMLNSMPRSGQWLLEPSAATMKAAPFNLISAKLSVDVLHANTHLYIADNPVRDFPGNAYKILEALPLSSSVLKTLGRTYPKAEIAVRNLKGFTPDSLRKKLKIKQGGDIRIYAATLSFPSGAAPVILVTQRG